MAKYSASEARANFNQVLKLAKTQAVEIHKHGKPAAVILDAMKYEELLDYVEDLEDQVAVLEFKLDPNQKTVPWEKVKSELGLS